MRSASLRRLGSLVVAASALLACGDDVIVPVGDEYSAEVAGDMVMAAPAPMAMSREASGGAAANAPFTATAARQPNIDDSATAASVPAIVPAMVIRDGTVVVEVDSFEPAIASLQAMATALGGYVGNSRRFAGARQTRQATLELKIPAARFNEALAGIEPLGQVEPVNSTAQHVGEEFMDVSARVANSQRLEDRLVTLLATRTGDFAGAREHPEKAP